MKKFSKIICFLLSFVTTVSFSACSFFNEFLSGDSSLEQSSGNVNNSSSSGVFDDEQNSEIGGSSNSEDFESSEKEENKEEEKEDVPTEKPVEAAVGSVAWYLQNGYKTVFNDPYVKNGVKILSVDGEENKTIAFGNSQSAPSWTFAQWHSKYDLRTYEKLKYTQKGSTFELASYGANDADGTYIPAKVLHINTQNPSIYMELNAELEFDKPKEDGEGWPHTLLSQDFFGELVHVSEQKELKAHMEYQVTKFVDRMNGQADATKHCAQLVWYVTLQNRNPNSEGYGQYVWFGFNLWDNRHSGGVSPEYSAQDLGKEDATKAFIYQPSSTAFFEKKRMPNVGEKAKIEFDFLPTAKYAFELARKRGYLPQTTWEDIYIGSMNFGWEVTGIYNVGVQIDTVGIYYK